MENWRKPVLFFWACIWVSFLLLVDSICPQERRQPHSRNAVLRRVDSSPMGRFFVIKQEMEIMQSAGADFAAETCLG